jgi:hypothetical protein
MTQNISFIAAGFGLSMHFNSLTGLHKAGLVLFAIWMRVPTPDLHSICSSGERLLSLAVGLMIMFPGDPGVLYW